MYLMLYVDDILLADKNKQELDKLKFKISQEFDMKDIRKSKRILKIQITRNRGEGKLLKN